MGGSVSTPVDTATPDILNFILREMFRRADLVDIYSLADPNRCSRYVIAGADALESLFVKVRINPQKKEKDGTLYFQSLDGLLTGMPQDLKNRRRQYCLELAFFFVRIFQIYGAIFLSIYDSRMPSAEPVDDVPPESQKGRQGVFVSPQDFYGFKGKKEDQSSKGFFSWLGLGGSLSSRSDGSYYITSGPYQLLNYHLSRPGPSQSAQPMKMEGVPILVDQATLYNLTVQNGEVTGREVQSDPTPLVQYLLQRNSGTNTLMAKLNITGADDLTVWLSDFKLDGVNKSISIAKENLKSGFGLDKPLSLGQGFPSTKGKSLPTVLQAMFEDAATRVLGETKFSVVKLLRKFNLLSGVTGEMNINGTHIYIMGEQDSASTVRIMFKDAIIVGDDKRKRLIRIIAQLTIEDGRQDVLKGTYSYRVYTDFSAMQIDPVELREYTSFKSYRDATFVAYSKDGAPRHEKTNATIPEYLETIFQDGIHNKDEDSATHRVKFTRDGLATPFDSAGIPTHMKVKELWTAMAKNPPVKAHCVARAVQLLNIEAFKGNFSRGAFSSACRLGFAYQKDGSLPMPKKSLSEEYGLNALAVLFFELTGGPNMKESDEYRGFLNFLRKTMGREAEPIPDPVFDKIREASPAVCDGKPADVRLQLPQDLAGNLRSVAKDLLAQQRDHVNSAMNVMFMLFNKESITKKRTFAFSKAILSGGMPEVERISSMARELLTKYYANCEMKYQSGLDMIYRYDKERPLGMIKPQDGTVVKPPAPAPVPGTPVPAARAPVPGVPPAMTPAQIEDIMKVKRARAAAGLPTDPGSAPSVLSQMAEKRSSLGTA